MQFMKTTSLPPVRVEPETRALFESVLREGESLSQFLMTAAREEADWRRLQADFVAGGLATLEDFRRNGNGGLTLEQVWARGKEKSRTAKDQIRAELARRAAAA
jgi:hypothetical protein